MIFAAVRRGLLGLPVSVSISETEEGVTPLHHEFCFPTPMNTRCTASENLEWFGLPGLSAVFLDTDLMSPGKQQPSLLLIRPNCKTFICGANTSERVSVTLHKSESSSAE